MIAVEGYQMDVDKRDVIDGRLYDRNTVHTEGLSWRGPLQKSLEEECMQEEGGPDAIKSWIENGIQHSLDLVPQMLPRVYVESGVAKLAYPEFLGKFTHDYEIAVRPRDVGKFASMCENLRQGFANFINSDLAHRLHDLLVEEGYELDDADITQFQIGIPGRPTAQMGISHDGETLVANPGIVLNILTELSVYDEQGTYINPEQALLQTYMHEFCHKHGITYEKYGERGAEVRVEEALARFNEILNNATGNAEYEAAKEINLDRIRNVDVNYPGSRSYQQLDALLEQYITEAKDEKGMDEKEAYDYAIRMLEDYVVKETEAEENSDEVDAREAPGSDNADEESGAECEDGEEAE